MPKTKTHFPQVPVEIAKKAAEAESDEEAKVNDAFEQPKTKSSNGNASAGRKLDA
jgi:hypothetical protein